MLQFDIEGTRNYSADTFSIVLELLGDARGLDHLLGVSTDGANAFVVANPHQSNNLRLGWVYNNNVEFRGHARISHYSGIRPYSLEDIVMVVSKNSEADPEVRRGAPEHPSHANGSIFLPASHRGRSEIPDGVDR